jgi:hypothetical protein
LVIVSGERAALTLPRDGPARNPWRTGVELPISVNVVLLSADLVRWFQLLCLDACWKSARPKALRWDIFHAPGRLVHCARRRIVRILDGWPSAGALLGAYRRIELIT